MAVAARVDEPLTALAGLGPRLRGDLVSVVADRTLPDAARLAEIMPAALDALAYADFENRYQDLIGLVRYCRSEAIKKASPDLASFMPKEELIDHFDQVLFSCKLEAVRAVHLEYLRRLSELKKKQFLANFLKLHPGIQHKAGVPLGGTFIIVYHDDPGPAGLGVGWLTPARAL